MTLTIPDKVRPYYAVFITLAQTFADAVAIVGSFWFGYFVYGALGNIPPQSLGEYWYIVGLATGIYLLIFRILKLYEREISLLNIEEMKKIFVASVWASLLFFSSTFYFRLFSLSRIMITISVVAALFFVYFERLIFYQLHLWFHERGFSKENVIVFGAGKVGKHLARRLFQSPGLGWLPVGFLDDDTSKHNSSITFRDAGPKTGTPVYGGEEALEKIATQFNVREVFIAMPSASYDRTMSIINHCRKQNINFSIVPFSYEQVIQKIQALEIGGIPILKLKKNSHPFHFRMAKRAVDFAVSTVLLAIFSPFILLFGILIKVDSKGPVIFKQKRVGLKGKEFTLYKFRTMFTESPKYAETPRENSDPRITRVGKWLRRSSLDELPQLFNVFRGDMSLVGPRPEMPFIVQQYDELHRERLTVKPGITGVWQISCVRGDPIHENIEYDLFYIEHQSMLLDMVILVKTFTGVVRGIGAV